MKTLHFDSDIAVAVGVEEAILYQNILYWCEKNKANEAHFHDGNWWTYNSAKAFAELFPFWNAKKIERLIGRLVEANLIAVGNYNQSKYDRTRWYSIVSFSTGQSGKIQSTDLSNGKDGSVEPIPDINTDDNPNNKQIPDSEKFCDWFLNNLASEATKKSYGPREKKKWSETYDKLVEKGYTKLQIAAACQYGRTDDFWKDAFYSPAKLMSKSKQGLLYIDLFLEKAAAEEAKKTAAAQKAKEPAFTVPTTTTRTRYTED